MLLFSDFWLVFIRPASPPDPTSLSKRKKKNKAEPKPKRSALIRRMSAMISSFVCSSCRFSAVSVLNSYRPHFILFIAASLGQIFYHCTLHSLYLPTSYLNHTRGLSTSERRRLPLWSLSLRIFPTLWLELLVDSLSTSSKEDRKLGFDCFRGRRVLNTFQFNILQYPIYFAQFKWSGSGFTCGS